MKLTFDYAIVNTLIASSLKAKKHSMPYGHKGKPKAGLILVGDQGVYIMSNEVYPDSAPKPLPLVYADQVNPDTMEFDAWWENKRASFGGDDGVEFIKIEDILMLRSQRPHDDPAKLVINLSPKQFSMSLQYAKQKARAI